MNKFRDGALQIVYAVVYLAILVLLLPIIVPSLMLMWLGFLYALQLLGVK
jgi:hypothetical protein